MVEAIQTNGESINGSVDNGWSVPDLYTLKYSLNDQHKASINSIKISPDGTRFATCSSDSTIKVFDLESGKCVAELRGHTKGISTLEFSPINSNIIASCSDDLTIRLWSVKKQKCINILKKHTYHITTIKFTTKGNMLISGSADETITIWDLTSGKTLKTLAAHSDPISSLSLTPDNSIIVSASFDGLMRLFDLETGQCLKTLTYNSTSHGTATASTKDVLNFPISNVELSPNGKYILSSSLDGYIRLWDYMDNSVLKTYSGVDSKPISEKYNCGAKFITKTAKPKVVSGSQSDGVLVWDLQAKKIVFQHKHDGCVFQVDTFDGGRVLVACTKDGVIDVFELNPKYVNDTGNYEDGAREETPLSRKFPTGREETSISREETPINREETPSNGEETPQSRAEPV